MANCSICSWALATSSNMRTSRGALSRDWGSHLMFFTSYVLVVWAARWSVFLPTKHINISQKRDAFNKQNHMTKHGKLLSNVLDESRSSLRFIACLLGIYLHVPLLLANYSLGFPSSAFWTPLLAIFVLPHSSWLALSEKKALLCLAMFGKFMFLLVTSPPVFLVPSIFQWYTPYVLTVYTPLHLLLAALWFV